MALEDLLARRDLPEDAREAIRQELARRDQPTSTERDLLQTLLDHMPDYVYFKDRHRRFVRASKAFCGLFGCSLDEIIGKRDEELFPVDIAAEAIRDDRWVIETGAPILNREEGGSIGERETWVLTTKLPWRDEQGHIVGLFGISKDITELKRSEIRFRSLIEQTTDAVFCYEYYPPISVDLPVDEQMGRLYDGVLVECNEVCAKSYGDYKREDVIGKRLSELFRTVPGSLDRLFREMIEGGYRIVDGEGVEKLADGSERYFLNNGNGVVENGQLIHVWGTFRDVTDRKRLEKELRESEKLASIGEMVSALAHEVRDPLLAMLATIDALEAEHGGSDAFQTYGKQLRGKLDSLLRLTRKLEDYGKP